MGDEPALLVKDFQQVDLFSRRQAQVNRPDGRVGKNLEVDFVAQLGDRRQVADISALEAVEIGVLLLTAENV